MKKFENLIMQCIDEEITGTRIEKLVEVKKRFESEMLYGTKQASPRIVQDWLQGLCSTVSLPFYNNEILEWYAKELKRPIKENEEARLCEKYWHDASITLFHMMYS